jgi:hypothetical protein
MQDALIFGLAYVGYVLVGANVVLHFWGRPRRALMAIMAAVVLLHVLLVWSLRFEWSLTYAWEKSPAGFLIFHTALVLLVAAVLAREPWSRRLLLVAFPIVTAGGLGAAFKYDFLAGYRVPLLAALVTTLLAGALTWCQRP